MFTDLELIRAGTEHEVILGNLLELYIHDFSELVPIDVDEDGRYGYKNLPLFLSDNSRFAFLAKLHGKVVGFVLVAKGKKPFGDPMSWDMSEFFVLRRYRRCGIGTQLAEDVWLHCPGLWQIRVMQKNSLAQRFWESSIAKFTGQLAQSTRYVEDGIEWHRFSLDSRRS